MEPNELLEFNIFSQEEIDYYLLGVYNNIITTRNLSSSYHSKVSNKLIAGLEAGFGQAAFTSEAYYKLKDLRSNIYAFSAAKQYQQVREMSEFINENGVKAEYKLFKEKASKVFNEYNKNYLKTEFNTSIGQGQSARDWIEAYQKKDIYPIVKYQTQRDQKVRDLHKALDGIALPIDHPFWNDHAPKNGWNCRCFLTSHTNAEKISNLNKLNLTDLEDKSKFPDLFKMNAGKDGIIFDPKRHPYFRVKKGDKNWRDENFGLVKVN